MAKFDVMDLYERWDGKRALLETWRQRWPAEEMRSVEVAAYMRDLENRVETISEERSERHAREELLCDK